MTRYLRLVPLLGLLLLGTFTPPARAQIDVLSQMSVGIWQSKVGVAPHLVGEIWREGSDPGSYVEHWVLFPDYVYPGADKGVFTSLRGNQRRYGGLADFFANVSFDRGSRYVRVDCEDTAVRPVVR